MFKRRAESGQCFHQPCLGCREFPAYYELVEKGTDETPINENKQLGWMLFDIKHENEFATAMFYNPKLEKGVICVPACDSEEVKS